MLPIPEGHDLAIRDCSSMMRGQVAGYARVSGDKPYSCRDLAGRRSLRATRWQRRAECRADEWSGPGSR